MLVSEFFSHKSPNFSYIRNADACVFLDMKDNILNRNSFVPPSILHIDDYLHYLPVASFDYVTSSSYDFLTRYKPVLVKSSKGKAILADLMNLPRHSHFLFIRVASNNFCFVVTEKYFNDGSHSVSSRYVETSLDNISQTFFSDNLSDNYISVFPNKDDAVMYLRSRFYIDSVAKRTKNRLAKVKSN